jgi:hypothetical protein
MGDAIKALSDTSKLLRHNPIILLLGGAAMALFAVVNFVLGLIPLIGNLLSFFIYPAFIAGLLSLIYAGRNGNAGVDDFTRGLGDSYLKLLGGYALLGIPTFVVVMVLSFAAVFAMPMGTTATGMGASPSPMSTAGPILLVFAFVGLLIGLVYLAFQFFNIAIVSGAGVVESFATSLSMTAEAPISTLGFTLTKAVLGVLLLGVPFGAVVLTGAGLAEVTSGGNPLAGGVLALGLLGYFVVGIPLWRVVSNTYHVAYFNRRQASLG